MNKKRIAIIAVIALILIYLGYSYFSPSSDDAMYLTTKVKKGNFTSEVITSGEAQSTSLKIINGPTNLRKFKLRDIKIQDLVAEGTIVKIGDYVGRLDPSGVNEQIIDERLNLETAESRYTQQQLDTTLTLKQERNTIKDLSFSMEETRLELKQSIYEPPATIKRLEINLEKSERDLKEKLENYNIKKRQANAKMVEVGTQVFKIRKTLNNLLELLESFTIYSDGDGMITYIREWNGSKKKVGSSISPWDPTIASLPDLTKMESKTYANEVDIRKIKKDLSVKVGFDAFPDIEMAGIVTDVANVGENKRGSDIKVFQVSIKLEGSDKNIRPGMTTSNKILTFERKNVLSIPLEAIFSKDSITYVYKKAGFSVTKKQVKIGESNNDSVIITAGLAEEDVVYLNKPEGLDAAQIVTLN
ncbi:MULTISPECIES: efflux RND transporter periplasmic adaptor subunit [unclassified Polaribacter]|uniref:efflux RND transporter periplasmic adaptor subunit n=1 Tax=unclassified Polaribacter TaxID=196858 RepID=UPI0011BE756B|nr:MULTISPECIES: HlyD family efflux transporter periplasmic adaptor subunit [unclassified Polaribacter]TXD51481.1 HlyD family efflux transporter periplasmic adaptor subunit [Polaribacter sp. IC063]TXD61791.1 HlyD family efflux transporter periplasmic adaptor subunit [Polaribacter sp. IC066]